MGGAADGWGFLTLIGTNKASGRQVFILELSSCNLSQQESETAMEADQAQARAFQFLVISLYLPLLDQST